MTRLRRSVPVVLILELVLLRAHVLAAEPPEQAEILVQVNGRPVTQADLELAYLVRGIAPVHREALRRPVLARLVDERLIAALLQRRRIKPSDPSLDDQMDQMIALIRRRGAEPDEVFARLGLDRQRLRSQLSLPLAWQTYAREVITTGQVQAYFDQHRRELDGTQIRARHIVLQVAADATDEAWEQARSRLDAIRAQIVSGRLTFPEAAGQHSQAPSAAKGGDVGYFGHRGTMPAPFADAAFDLKPGELSLPLRTRAGLHLIEVTDERPGELSLEDVRETVFDRLSAELWDQQLIRERARARIVWTRPEDAAASP